MYLYYIYFTMIYYSSLIIPIDIERLRMTSMSLRSPEQQKAAEDTAKFWRENVGRSKALGPPDTKLFASGLSALTAQPKSHPQWYTMKAEWEEKVKAAQDDLVSLLQARRYRTIGLFIDFI